MYKHVALLVRDDGLTHGEFVEYWKERHSPLVTDVEGVVRYQTVYPVDPERSEYDGVAELYFESLEDLYDALGSPGSRDDDPTEAVAAKAREDVDNFVAIEGRLRFVGEEKVWKDAIDGDGGATGTDGAAEGGGTTGAGTATATPYGDTDGLYKHSAFLVRKNGMSHEAFREYWETEHSPLAATIEGVVRYHTVYPVDPAQSAFDGVAELYFETLEDLHDALGSPGSRDYDPTKEVAAQAREDVDNFLAIEERPRFIGRERVWKDETGTEGGPGGTPSP
jgi:uncharacterized protein (TIGR02118 family)